MPLCPYINDTNNLGFNAVLIYGDPDYYCRFGFKGAKKFNIRTSDGYFLNALMALELKDGALINVSGRLWEGDVYSVNNEELTEFEKRFRIRKNA